MSAPAKTRLGPNDLEECPSPGTVRRHLAKAEACPVCGVDGRQPRTAQP